MMVEADLVQLEMVIPRSGAAPKRSAAVQRRKAERLVIFDGWA